MDNTNIIIFSKNRAMQLDLCIRSLLVFGNGMYPHKITVIYNVDTKEHRKSYDKLKYEYSYINFIESFNFQQSVVESCKGSKHIFFIVDDCVFTHKFDVQNITQLLSSHNNAIGFSLRLGKNTTYCYPIDKHQVLPEYTTENHGTLKFDWTKSEYDFGYPLEVSSSIYRTEDILPFIENLEYSNPNQLEGLLDHYKTTFANKKSYLMCFTSSCAFCLPINKINKFNENRSGENNYYSIENLLRLFGGGMRISLEKFKSYVPSSPHEEVTIDLVYKDDNR